MTEANQKKLYEHYIATGQKKNAEALLKVYPQFAKTEKIKKK